MDSPESDAPDDTMRMILTAFAATAEEQIEKFRARAREFHEEAESFERRAVDRHQLAQEYDRAADLLETYQKAGHKAATALHETLNGSPEPSGETPGMRMARLVQQEKKERLF